MAVAAVVGGMLAGPLTGSALASPLSFQVNTAGNANDTSVGDGLCDTSATTGLQCTLRAAIQEANANPGPDAITFNMASPYKVTLTNTGLPAITSPVTIDGTTQPSFNPPTVIVRVDANSVSTGNQYDFDVESGGGGTTIKGLELVGAGTAEVHLADDGNTVSGDYIGVTSAGTTTCGSGNCGGVDGVRIEDASNNVVGGLTAVDRNLISNNSYGVHVLNTAGTSSNNVIEGNYIGVNKTGTTAVPNGEGVYVDDESGNDVGPSGTVIGGTAAGAGNLIAGNNDTGVYLNAGANASITGNTIGLNSSGAKLGNSYGIYVSDQSTSVTIGGPTAASRNVVSGNNQYGIEFAGPVGTSLVQNNYVGVSASGSLDRGNGYEGIYAGGANNLTVDSNVVSGNNDSGASSQLHVLGGDGDVVSNNIVSLAADGTTALPGPCYGLQLDDDTNLTVTGNTTGSNACNGFEVSGVTGASFTGNRSGTDVTGTLSRPNSSDAIYLNQDTDIQLGTAASGNQFSASQQDGIDANNLVDSSIQGNMIGTNAAGTATLVNGQIGLFLGNSQNVTVGGTNPGEGNVEAGTTGGCCGAGVYLATSSYVSILGNRIGIGTGGQNLGNGYDGIALDGGALHDTIGSTNPAGANIITNSGNDGICNTGNRIHIVGNSIYANGSLGIDNGCDGVSPDDTGDADTGPNGLQNFPVLTNSLSNASGTQVTGTLNSRPNKTYTLDFYASNGCDSSGNGEGQTYLGTKPVTTDGSGNVSFTAQVPASAADNAKITATATDATGDTSEFSACRVNHSGLPTMSIANSSASEGAGTMSFTVSLDGPPVNTPVTVNYATADGTATAPADYTASSGTVTFNAGETSKQVTVPIVNDTVDENDETFTVTLSNPTNALIGAGQGSATGTIVDDDPAPTVSVTSNGDVVEGNSGTVDQSFKVRLSKASSLPITVLAATTGGSATADVDFQSNAALISFAPGETQKTFTVKVIGDTLFESKELYAVNLFSPTNATIGSGHSTGAIDNDDAAPQITVADLSLPEGNSGTSTAKVTVSLNTVSGLNATVQLHTVDGTATAPSDYTQRGNPTPVSLTIPAGQTTATFGVTIKGDTVVEPDETFTVQTVGTPTNSTIADGSGSVTITNDD